MAIDIEKICRTCLGLNSTLHSIYDSDGVGELCLADMLRDFTETKPHLDDGLPDGVCLSCISEINRCYSFKLKCENSCRTLRQLVSDSLAKAENDSWKVKVLQYNNSAQTIQPKFINQLPSVCTQTKVILKPERNHQEDDNTRPTLFEEPKLQRLDKIKLEKELEEDMAKETEITETAVAENIQSDLSDNRVDQIILKFEAEDEEINENVPKITVYSPLHAEKEDLNENTLTHQLTTEKQSGNISKHQNIFNQTESNNPENNLEFNTCRGDNKNKLHSNNTEHVPKNAVGSIIQHPIVAETKPGNLLHLCESCGAGFTLHRSLVRHTKQNICKKLNFECDKCDRVFISLETLNEHNATHLHDHECTECGLFLQTSRELGQHMIKVHKRDLRNQCPICKKIFILKIELNDHLHMHSGEKPFTCTICQKGFTQKTNLKLHLMRHSKEKKFKCTECEMSFVTNAELCSHQRTHTGEHPFRCDECPASYTQASSLVKHKRKHKGEQPYACDLCPKHYTSSFRLENHRRMHTGERPYKCRWCSKTFTQKAYCISHQLTHTDDRSHDCFCGKKFKHSSALHRHMKSHQFADCGDSDVVPKVVGRVGVKRHSTTLLENDTATNLRRRDSDACDEDNDEKMEIEVAEDLVYDEATTIVKVEWEEVVSEEKPLHDEKEEEVEAEPGKVYDEKTTIVTS